MEVMVGWWEGKVVHTEKRGVKGKLVYVGKRGGLQKVKLCTWETVVCKR